MRVGVREGDFVVSFKPPITGQDVASMPKPGGQPFETIEKVARSTVITFAPEQLLLGEISETLLGYSRRVVEFIGHTSLDENIYHLQPNQSPFEITQENS